MSQNALTVIARIAAGKFSALEKVLDEIGQNPQSNTYIPFGKIASLHFACLVVIKDNPKYPPYLVLESNHDGSNEEHIRELIRVAGKGLDAVYGFCEGYPAGGSSDAEKVFQYFLSRTSKSPAFYIGCPGQSVASIHNAIAVREEIETFLDGENASGTFQGKSAMEIHGRISKFMAENPRVKVQPSPVTIEQQNIRAWINLILIILVGLPIVILLLPLLLIYVIALRVQEQKDLQLPLPEFPPIDPRLFEAEDIYTQNHLTTMVEVKPGKFRLRTLQFVLWLINLLAKAYFTTGSLGGIPTIHFARWILMDDNRRLLFFSNYDGSWASYLGDFVDKANYGLTAVWSNTATFPPATFLFWGGAQHIEEFKRWSRNHNCYAAVWYSAYPEETLVNLLNDVQIRDNLGKTLGEETARQFLQRL